MTLLSGSSGSGKTVFAAQFLAAGIERFDHSGVFVTFEESPTEIARNLEGFGWQVERWVEGSRWAFVDGSRDADQEVIELSGYDLRALLARIEHAVRKVGARRVVIDSIGALFGQLADPQIVRHELFRVIWKLKQLGVTAILTAERSEEYGPIAHYGVEEFVSDSVVILRNVLQSERRRRTVEILKARGTSHQKGEYPFAITPDEGAAVIPLSALEMSQSSSDRRISSGITTLDTMCGGGFFRDSIVLVSGATGTGKTLTVTQFLDGGIRTQEQTLLLAFEESREQLIRNANGWGVDLPGGEAAGYLKITCLYPEVQSLEDHLLAMKRAIEEFNPKRIAIDSLSALERVASDKAFREFVVGLSAYVRGRDCAVMLTSNSRMLGAELSTTDTHISTITDSIIVLRYVEVGGKLQRGIAVLKMRGSAHDTEIREYTISGDGMRIGRPFRNLSGILSGRPMRVTEGARHETRER